MNDAVGGVRRRRRQRQRQLWQFLLEILCDDEYSPSIIEWVRREDGVFRFVNPRSVAELWGRRRRRQTMTYEHLSRAMRYAQHLVHRVSEKSRPLLFPR